MMKTTMPGVASGHNPFDPDSKLQKVDKIFKLFDANGDGYLNRQEMAALVMAVNPRVRFTEAQINAILDEVFRGYGEFIAGDKGLRQDGLLRTYNDGAGDIDRDFEALGLKLGEDDDDDAPPAQLPPPPPAAAIVAEEDQENEQQHTRTASLSSSGDAPRRKQLTMSMSRSSGAWAGGPWPPSWTASPNNGIVYADTWHIVEDLDTLVRRAESKRGNMKRLAGADLASFQRSLTELCGRADCSRTQDEAFDAHMAMGRTLFDHAFFDEALCRFKRATELRPTDVRPYFRSGNSLCSLGRLEEAVECYKLALEAANNKSPVWCALLPQIHVNLGISLEGQGMLLCACMHYREAVALSPSHYRALKLLGSALLGLGEYRAAEKALTEALAMKPDYADAHCDLGSVLHAAGDSDRAIAQLHKALQLDNHHLDALYNLGGCFRDCGRFSQSVDAYTRLLSLDNNHWQAHLNKAVSLLGMGNIEQAVESMKQAFKLTNRIEIFDEMKHLRYMQKNPSQLNVLLQVSKQQQHQQHTTNMLQIPGPPLVPVVDPSRLLRSSNKTTPSMLMRCALEMRAFQKHTRFNRCNVRLLSKQALLDSTIPTVAKTDIERVVRSKLLPLLAPETFQGTIKSLNERVLSVLDRKGCGKVDFGMFLAVLAPICAGGEAERRKHTAFEALVCPKKLAAEISRATAKSYFNNLKSVYMPLHSRPDDRLWEIRGEDENTSVGFPEFLDMFEESSDLSFSNIVETLMKLETGDRTRHSGINCSVCSYEIIGPRFKEVSAGFNLCSMCYSEGKVPPDMLHEEYFCFKEYNNDTDAIKEKLLNLGSKVPKFS